MRPGVEVLSRALPPPRSAPTNTGVCFIIGATHVTDDPYALVHSLDEFVTVFGPRGTGPEQTTFDAVDVYFREGGSQCYVASTTSTVTFAAMGVQTRATEADLQAMTRNELDSLASDIGLDPEAYSTKSDAVAAIQQHNGDVVTTLAVDAGIAKALAALTKDLGPGQVLVADPALAAAPDTQAALLAHAAACNRVALLSCADGDATALAAVGTALQLDANARYGALFAPSAIVPGVAAGTTRTVPYTAVQAGIIARNDVAYSPDQASAGVLGQSVFASDLVGNYSDADYANLNLASVDMARMIYGGVRTYGARSCVDPDAVPQWTMFTWARLNMAIVAQAEAIGEAYMFSQIDGRGRKIASFGGDLSAMLAVFYDTDALYGATPEEAYDVDVGVAVNTEATIANGELHAILSVRMSDTAEWVVIEIVKVATDQTLPATAVSVAA